MQCPTCRAELRAGVTFCTRCGARSGGRGRAGAIAAGLFLVAASAGGGYYWFFVRSGGEGAKVECSGGRCPKIGAKGGRIVVSDTGTPLDRVRIEVPAGALDERVAIAVSEGKPLDAAALAGATAAGPSVHLEPDGQRFDEPVMVRLPFSAPEGTRDEDVRVVVASGERRETVTPSEVDVKRGLVTFPLSHFSIAVVVLAAKTAAAGTGAPVVPPKTVWSVKGNFTLRQYDQPGRCVFSEGPTTFGTINLVLDQGAGSCSGTLQGGGHAERGLSCTDGDKRKTGVQSWNQAYGASFSGTIDAATGQFNCEGRLTGESSATYSACTEDGESSSCPPARGDKYDYKIKVHGGLDRSTSQAQGRIELEGPKLLTEGTWTASE